MKFGKNLREKTLKEWRFYSVDYKALKKTLKLQDDSGKAAFFRVLEDSETKISAFYHDKEKWAFAYMKKLEERVEALRAAMSSPSETPTEAESSSSDVSLSSNDEENFAPEEASSIASPIADMDGSFFKALDKRQSFGTKQAWLKEEYRRMGSSKQFKAFIYAKKSLATFDRELALLVEFLELNTTAFSKILKKLDKRTGSSIREDKMFELMNANSFLDGHVLLELKGKVGTLIDETNAL